MYDSYLYANLPSFMVHIYDQLIYLYLEENDPTTGDGVGLWLREGG